jgi:hypothetical protein
MGLSAVVQVATALREGALGHAWGDVGPEPRERVAKQGGWVDDAPRWPDLPRSTCGARSRAAGWAYQDWGTFPEEDVQTYSWRLATGRQDNVRRLPEPGARTAGM